MLKALFGCHDVLIWGKSPISWRQRPDISLALVLGVKHQLEHKNATEVDIAPASGKITKNMKYRSRAPGQGARLNVIPRTITM